MPVSFFSQVASSVRKRLIDTFSTRTDTTGSLGTAVDGSRWNATSQTIQVTSGAAKATTTPSSSGTSYPIATVSMPTQNNIIKLKDINQGSAAAIWVQSSSDWWMVGVDAEYNTVPGNTSYAYSQNAYNTEQGQNSSNQFSFSNYAGPAAGGSYSTYYTSYGWGVEQTGGGTTNYKSTTKYSIGFANGPPKYTAGASYTSYTSPATYSIYQTSSTNSSTYTSYYYYASGTGYAYNGVNYFYFTGGGNYTTFSFTNATTYAYSQILRVRQSVGGTVSTVASAVVSAAQTAKSLLVSLSGNQITAKAYSDTNNVSQIGSDLVYTATGATVNTTFGIALSPSAYQQSDIIATSVEITRN